MSSTTNVDSPQGDRPHHVVVVGGSYAGLSAIVHLLALADGRKLPTGDNPLTGLDVRLRRRLDLTLIDERDGFCTPRFFLLSHHHDRISRRRACMHCRHTQHASPVSRVACPKEFFFLPLPLTDSWPSTGFDSPYCWRASRSHHAGLCRAILEAVQRIAHPGSARPEHSAGLGYER